MDHSYYVLFCLLNKRKLTSLVKKYGLEINDYVRCKNISFQDTIGRIKVIAYYNAISECKKEGDC